MQRAFIAFLVIASTPLSAAGTRSLSVNGSISCEHVLGLTYVEASVNGSRPLTMVLDSGAFHTVLQPQVAAALHLQPSGTQQTTGLGADATLLMVHGARLGLADQTLTGQTIAVLPLGYIEEEAGHETDGLLGGNVFMKFTVEEDYRVHRVTLVPPAQFTPPADYTAVPAIISGNLAFVELMVGGFDGAPVKGTFLLDSGTVGNMILMKPFLDAHPSLEPKVLVDIPSVTAVGGATEIAAGRLDLLRLGSYSMRDVPAAFLRNANPSTPATLAGILGNGILQRFDVIFDYPHGKRWLRPNAEFSSPFPVLASGILLTVNPPHYRAVLVRDVIAGSPAADAGVRPGDRIVRIRVGPGEFLNVNSLAQANDAMSSPGKDLTLEISRTGKRVTVKLQTRALI